MTVPGAMDAVPAERLYSLNPFAQIKTAAPHHLPHPIGGRGHLRRLRVVGAGTERDSCSPDGPRVSSSVDGPTNDRQIGRRVAPPWTADLEVIRSRHGSEEIVALGRRTGPDEGYLTVI